MRVYIFDFDGVLCNTDQALTDLDLWDRKDCLYEEPNCDDHPGAMIADSAQPLLAGVDLVLQAAEDKGAVMAILSGRNQTQIYRFLDRLRIRALFPVVMGLGCPPPALNEMKAEILKSLAEGHEVTYFDDRADMIEIANQIKGVEAIHVH